MEEQYKSSFVRALAERWEFWKPMAVDKVGKLDRVPRMILRSALDSFDVFNRMPEFLEKLDGDDIVRGFIESEIKALAAAIEEAPNLEVEIIAEETPMTTAVEAPMSFIASDDGLLSAEETKAEDMEEAVELSETGKHIADIWKDHGSDSLVEYAAPEKPEPQYVQVLDPDTDRWQIVDRDTGVVTNRKKSPGPYKDVPTMEEVNYDGDGKGNEQANAADQAEAEQ